MKKKEVREDRQGQIRVRLEKREGLSKPDRPDGTSRDDSTHNILNTSQNVQCTPLHLLMESQACRRREEERREGGERGETERDTNVERGLK